MLDKAFKVGLGEVKCGLGVRIRIDFRAFQGLGIDIPRFQCANPFVGVLNGSYGVDINCFEIFDISPQILVRNVFVYKIFREVLSAVELPVQTPMIMDVAAAEVDHVVVCLFFFPRFIALSRCWQLFGCCQLFFLIV